MKYRRIAVLGLLIFLIFPSLVYADIIGPGQKGVKHCIEISNINDFPDYDFYLISFMGERVHGVRQLRQGSCESFYKFTTGRIYAGEKQELDSLGMEDPVQLMLHGDNQTDILGMLISSDVQIHLKSTAPMFSLISGQKDMYTIRSIGDSIELDKKTSYTFDYMMIPVYMLSFVFTILIEALIILALMRKRLGLGFKKSLGYSGLVNTITYPLALLFYILLLPSLILVETFVFIAEIFLIKHFLKTRYRDSFVISLTANLATMVIGFSLFFLLIFLL